MKNIELEKKLRLFVQLMQEFDIDKNGRADTKYFYQDYLPQFLIRLIEEYFDY